MRHRYLFNAPAACRCSGRKGRRPADLFAVDRQHRSSRFQTDQKIDLAGQLAESVRQEICYHADAAPASTPSWHSPQAQWWISAGASSGFPWVGDHQRPDHQVVQSWRPGMARVWTGKIRVVRGDAVYAPAEEQVVFLIREVETAPLSPHKYQGAHSRSSGWKRAWAARE